MNRLERSDRRPRHEHRVRSFSRDYSLIADFGASSVVTGRDGAQLVAAIATEFNVPAPDVATNARRLPDTGQCSPPRWHAIETIGARGITEWERRKRRPYPEHGEIRLGTTTTLRTIAHEMGHHLVHCLDPFPTPGHGKVWVGRFDDAMGAIVKHLGRHVGTPSRR